MNTIHKQILDLIPNQIIQVPKNSTFLDTKNQKENLSIWYICNPNEAETEDREILIFGTGNDSVPEDTELDYLGTILMENDNLVWHIFEKLS